MTYVHFILCVVLAPQFVQAFDYGPVGNSAFWVVLVVWSVWVAYILLQKREVVWSVIGTFAHALLTPGVRQPKRGNGVQRNPHIVAESPAVQPAPIMQQMPTTGAVPHEPTPVQPIPVRETPATFTHRAATHTEAHVSNRQRASHTDPVIHSGHMSAPAHTPAPPQSLSLVAPAAVPHVETGGPTTTDTLTLEIIGGVPKMILKREVKK